MSDWVRVARLAEIGDGERRVVDVDGALVAIFNVGGELFALEDVCTHDGGEIASGQLIGDEIVCPRHGARFCVKTGAVRCAPAYEPIAKFPVKVEGGLIYVRDDRWD